MTCCR